MGKRAKESANEPSLSLPSGSTRSSSSSFTIGTSASPSHASSTSASSGAPSRISAASASSSSRIRSTRLALEEVEEEGDNNYRPIQPPVRKLSEHSRAQGSYVDEYTPEPPPLTQQKTTRATNTTTSSSSHGRNNHEFHSHNPSSEETFGKWAASPTQQQHNHPVSYTFGQNNGEPMLYPSTDDLSSRSSLTGDFSLSRFESMRSANGHSYGGGGGGSSRSFVSSNNDDSSKASDSLRTTSTMATYDLVLAKRYAAGYGNNNSDINEVGTRLQPPKLETIQSQGWANQQEVATGVLIDDDDEDDDEEGGGGNDIYKVKRRQQQRQQHPSNGTTTQPPLLRTARSAPITGLNKTRTTTPSSTTNRRGSADDFDNHHHHPIRVRSDSLSTMSTMPDPPSLRQGGHYTEPGAYRMRSGGEARMTTDVDSLAEGSLRTQTTTITRPPVLEASLVGDDDMEMGSLPPPIPPPLPSSSRYPDDGHYHHRVGSRAPPAAEVVAAPATARRTTRRSTNNTNINDDSTTTDDEEYPSPPPPANYTVSQGEVTLMTTATTASPIVEAKPMDEAHTFREFFANPKVRLTICCLSIVFIVLALGTIWGVTGFVFDNDDGPVETSAPSPVPTLRGDPNLDYFVNEALPDYTREALRKENSPQSKALAWLKNNTYLLDYKLSQRKQRFALATFYYATGGDRRWQYSTGWLSDEEECTWYSRMNQTDDVCKKGEYIHLNLEANQMRGTIPKEIALLSSLRLLDLDVNIITGFIPTTFGEMSLLREIHLYDNYISGVIPSEINGTNTPSLEVLNLQYNFIAQRLPETLGQLGNLKVLLLDRNALAGELPIEYGQLSMLETFNLYYNYLEGPIPPQLGMMTSLLDLRLDANGFSGSIPTTVGKLLNLQAVSFGNNTLTGSIPTEIGMLRELTYLDTFDNELVGPIPSQIGLLTNAKRLYFEHNLLTGSLPTTIGNLQNAELLWAHGNQFTSTVPTEIGLMTDLQFLDLSANALRGSLPTEFGQLSAMDILYLERNEFSGQIPSELGRLSNLTLMALHGNQFTGTMPVEICALVETGKLSRVNLTVNCEMVFCDQGCCSCID